jgi:cytosine/adenosine deaminase-related metal-dependent hydrolase
MKRGINVCIGTDSLASNTRLDLFGEMACLAASHPGLRPEAILRAATEAGARALWLWPKMGRIGPGASPPLLAIGPVPKRLDEVCEFLVKEACRQPGFIRRMIGVG